MLEAVKNYFQRPSWQTWRTNSLASVPPADWKWMYGYIAFFVACGVAACVLHFIKLRQEYKDRLLTFFWTNFFLGLFFWFCRWQRIPYLGMDLLRMLQELGAIIWIALIANYIITDHPKQKVQELATERFNKYLPKQKSV